MSKYKYASVYKLLHIPVNCQLINQSTKNIYISPVIDKRIWSAVDNFSCMQLLKQNFFSADVFIYCKFVQHTVVCIVWHNWLCWFALQNRTICSWNIYPMLIVTRRRRRYLNVSLTTTTRPWRGPKTTRQDILFAILIANSHLRRRRLNSTQQLSQVCVVDVNWPLDACCFSKSGFFSSFLVFKTLLTKYLAIKSIIIFTI